MPDNEAASHGGRLIARLRVDVSAGSPTLIDERVNVWLKTDKPASPVSIRVTGRIASPVEVTPDALVLPLRTDAEPVYRGSVLCRTHGVAAHLRVADSPPGYVVSLGPSTPGTPQRVAIEQRPEARRPGRATVTLVATINGIETTHSITIISLP
jgi:hypothetical protein